MMDTFTPDPSDFSDPSAPYEPLQGRDEMNLAEFPFASLRTIADSRDAICYEGWVIDEAGERQRQRWEVTGSTKAGLPTEFDERVFIALMAISAENGFQTQKVPFSVYQILKIMRMGDRSRNYEQVERALDRLVGVTIYADGSFWDNARRQWVKSKSGFHLVDKYWLAYREEDERVREQEGVQGYIIWSKDIWESIQSGYIKRLDLHFFYGLERPMARRLYRFLDKRMHYRSRYEIDIFELSGRLGMTAYEKPSQIYRKLQPAIEELIERAYLVSAETVKVRGYTRVRFVRTVSGKEEREATSALPDISSPEAELPEELRQLRAALEEVGLAGPVAHMLVTTYPAARIREKLEFLAWVRRYQAGRVRSPHGWLRRAIEEDWGAPQGYHSAQPALFDGEGEGLDEMDGEWTEISLAPEQALWEAVLRTLELSMTRATFDQWLRDTQLVACEEAYCTVLARPQAIEWLGGRLYGQIQAAIEQQLGRQIEVDFVSDEEEP